LAGLAQRGLREYSARLPWGPHAAAAAASILTSGPAAAIVSTSPPIVTHLVALRLKSRFAIPWIADFRDPFADNPARSLPLQRRYDPWLERRIFDRADAVIANTDAVADMWARKYPRHKRKIHLIWNGFDPAEEFPRTEPASRSRVELAHVGDIYGPRNPSAILEAVERLLNAGRISPDRLHVNLVGPAEGSSMWSLPAFQKLSAAGIVSCNNQVIPRADALRVIASADRLLLLDVNPAGGNLQVPAKIFDYVRAHRPILATTRSGSPVDRILEQSGVFYARISPDDEAAAVDRKLAAFIESAPAVCEPRQWFWDQFDGRNQARALASVIDGIGLQRIMPADA
jgi:glycosyltransferase involved in cell wall biosynthesis